MYFFLLLTQATALAVHILSHPSLGVGKIICSLVEAGKVTRHTCLYMSALDKLLQRKKEMETESYERSSRGKVGRVGTRAGAADRHMIARQKICEMLNGFVTFTQYFVI